jgi:hypothetical protein
MYGGDEFQPLTREALLAADPSWRNFVVLVEPLLAPLRTALAEEGLPAEWSLRQEISEDRLRRVDMLLTHRAGGTVRLRFVAPGRGQSPIVRTAAYDADAEADLSVPLPALSQLLDWLCGHLAKAEGLGAVPMLAEDAIERALHPAITDRGRQRVALLASRLQRRFAMRFWHLEKLRWLSETVAEIVAIGPSAARVALRFTVAVRANRSQIGVDFELSNSDDSAVTKPVVDALVHLLRITQPATPAAFRTAASAAC